VFVDSGIQDVVHFLRRRQASLWHACQLVDLAAYFALGGIPARSLLERRRLQMTPFDTDAVDRRNGVWDKVFRNLDDFGRSFAAGWRAVPNPYGPIVLQVRPEALLGATDVAIALRSAGAHDFDREGESLSTIDEVDRIYRHPANSGFPLSADTRFGAELQYAFSRTPIEAKAAEVSVSTPDELIPFEYVTMARAEPFVVAGVQFERVVQALGRTFDVDLPVRPRLMGERGDVWHDIIAFLADGPVPFTWILNRADAAEPTRRWLQSVHERGLDWQFDRFATYLYAGTLEPMLSSGSRAQVALDRATSRSSEYSVSISVASRSG
jgi:hypothetical protein